MCAKRGFIMKRILLLPLILIFFVTICPLLIPSPAQAANIKLTVDGRLIYTDVSPAMVDGRVLVPVRNIFDALDGHLVWDSVNNQVYGSKGVKKIWLTIGNTVAYNGNHESVTLDVPAQIISGRTMVPLRFIAESLGCQVNWDPTNQVVSIESEQATPTEDVFNLVKPSLVEIKQGDSLGSGFFFSNEGEILTNVHVINGTGDIKVTTYDNKTYKADVECLEPIEDIAILKLENASITYEPIYSYGMLSTLQEGEGVIAIGNPFGLQDSISSGIISGIRTIGDLNTPLGDTNQTKTPSPTPVANSSQIQMTAPISPGNSGGPLLDMNGNVIGISVSYIEGGQNLNFCVPIDDYFSLKNITPSDDTSEATRFQSTDKNWDTRLKQIYDDADNDLDGLSNNDTGSINDFQNHVLPEIDSLRQNVSSYTSTDPDIQYCVSLLADGLNDLYKGNKDLLNAASNSNNNSNSDDPKVTAAEQEIGNGDVYASEYEHYRQNILCILQYKH